MKSVFASVVLLLTCCLPRETQQHPSPEDPKEIAKDAWIYGFPMFATYLILAEQIINTELDYNQIQITRSTVKPNSTGVVSPNADTPYSFVWLDLRAEPIVLGVPRIKGNRYYAIQLIDLYTFVFAYIGTRTTGQKKGKYMIAGPNWSGEKPPGVNQVIRSETDIVFALYRTQAFNEADVPKVIAIQKRYTAVPLSSFLNKPAPPSKPSIKLPAVTQKELLTTKAFLLLNSLLRHCQPTHPSEVDLMKKFGKIGIKPSVSYDPPPGMRKQILAGIANASQWLSVMAEDPEATGYTTKAMFGTREYLNGNYEIRAVGAAVGLFGNYYEEATYPMLFKDNKGRMLDGSKNKKYTLTFEGGLPPVGAFWSVTMYDKKSGDLITNPINRYLINSPMIPSLVLNSDGGLTIYLQHERPTTPKEAANWLPSPDGLFYVVIRLYIPQDPINNGTWKVPSIVKTA